MTMLRTFIAALLLIAGCVPVVVSAQPDAAATAPTERRVMVMLKLGADHYRAGSDYGGPYGDAMAGKARLRLARQIARANGLTLIEAWPMQMIGVDCVIMSVPDGRSVQDVADTLTNLPGVAWSQPYNEFHMQASGPSTPIRYNDRLYAAQPSAAMWNIGRLHQVATGRGVTIAIVDSRIETTHPDLAGQIAASPDFSTAQRRGGEQHGTGVAGIIAARPNNALGIAGIAPGARILGLRACWEQPYGGATICDTLSLAKALTYALENGADVINLSLTGPQDRLLQTLIGVAIRRGATVVAAVDTHSPGASFPAFVSGVIPVADERLPARLPTVYIAPGRDIPTTEPEGKWSIVSGSSFAAAHVSGLAALLRQLEKPAAHRGSANALLGARGPVDACAAVARLSRLDLAACESGR